jgi:acyloxyacyl hydrolase
LYAILSDRIHPIGRVKNDVQYKDVYTFLSCLQISPCNGWLTINDTERQITTETAVLLSEVIKNVTLTNKFKNFDMEYIDFPSDEMFQRW